MEDNKTQWFVPAINRNTKYTFFSAIKYFFGIKEELTYKERIAWFVQNFYETGMEYPIMLDNMRNENLDKVKWYDDFIKIPKYTNEL